MDRIIITQHGRRIDLDRPDPSTLHLTDIAAALASLPCAHGRARSYLSMAQHAVMLAERFGPARALEALFARAEHAYMGIIPAVAESPAYRDDCRRIRRALAIRFGVSATVPPDVVEAYEELNAALPAGGDPAVAVFIPTAPRAWSPQLARQRFIDAYEAASFQLSAAA